MFLEHQISILEWILKEYVTMKAAENSAYKIFFKQIIIENRYFNNCNYFTILMFLLYFY